MATFNRAADPRAIHAVIRATGTMRVIDFLELHARFARELGDRYWLVSQPALRSRAAEMREGLGRWSDVVSRAHYARLLCLPAHG